MDRETDRTPVGQLRRKPLNGLNAESAFAQEMVKTGRPDCLRPNGLAGGLLAPVYLLMEKKGTGCKL